MPKKIIEVDKEKKVPEKIIEDDKEKKVPEKNIEVDKEKEKKDIPNIEIKIDKLIDMIGKVINKDTDNNNIDIPQVPKIIEVEKIEEIEKEEEEIILEVGKEKKSLGYYVSKFLVGG